MRFLTNGDVSSLLDMRMAVEALRTGYEEFQAARGAQIPRADLLAPALSGTYRLGVMAGVSRAFDTAVVRIKSDVVGWEAGREDKFASTPGYFSGTIIAFRISDGAPIAIVQDGVLQHLRVAAAAALGTQMLAPGSPTRWGILGSGGMARGIVEALAALALRPTEIQLFSPNPDHRRRFVSEVEERFPYAVVSEALDPEGAVRGAGLVVSATNSTEPTIASDWLDPDVHVTAVSRREVGMDLRSAADLLACLGPSSYPAEHVAGMTRTRGGYGAFLALSDEERSGLPEARPSDNPDEYPLMVEGLPWVTRPVPYRTVLTSVGTQGVQFAATVGALLEAADLDDVGVHIPDELFLHQVRN